MIVKREQFSTNEGVEGEKIYGEFNFSDMKTSKMGKKMEYQILAFKNAQSLQVIEIYNNVNDNYASDIKKRMFNSVEIEISGK